MDKLITKYLDCNTKGKTDGKYREKRERPIICNRGAYVCLYVCYLYSSKLFNSRMDNYNLVCL